MSIGNSVLSGMLTLMLAKFVLNDVPHALLSEAAVKGQSSQRQLKTVHITKEAQQAMLDLIRRAKSKTVEYQLELLLEDDEIYPGRQKWGAPERVRAFETGIGIFHTHPAEKRLVEVRPKIRYELIHRPAELSQVDLIHILVNPGHSLIGVAGTETYLAKAIPYGLEETADVQFAAQVKEYPDKQELLRILPMVAGLGVPVEGLEEYYRTYEFSLGPVVVPIEVLV